MLTFGQRLKTLRKEAQLTQAELAEKIMVSVQAISKWECNSTMPDISQIVPLAAILGVTTDCLLGVGGDEKTDRERLREQCSSLKSRFGIDSRENNFYMEAAKLYREHIKKYPLDYHSKLCLANCLLFYLNRTTYNIPREEENNIFNEALRLYHSVINYDNDASRLVEAKNNLAYLYCLRDDFEKAESAVEEVPNINNLKNLTRLEIYRKKKEYEKGLEIVRNIYEIAMIESLIGFRERARQISIFGNVRKLEAISAWRDLEGLARYYHKVIHNRITMKWVLEALSMISDDYIAISEFDKALEAIEEYTSFAICFYNECKASDMDKEELAEICSDVKGSFRSCYWHCLTTSDTIIGNDPRFKKCKERLEIIVQDIL